MCADGLRCSQTSESAELLQLKVLIASLAPRISLKASKVNAGPGINLTGNRFTQ